MPVKDPNTPPLPDALRDSLPGPVNKALDFFFPPDDTSIPLGPPALGMASQGMKQIPAAVRKFFRVMNRDLPPQDPATILAATKLGGKVPPATPIKPPKGFTLPMGFKPARAEGLVNRRGLEQELLNRTPPEPVKKPIIRDTSSKVAKNPRGKQLTPELAQYVLDRLSAGATRKDLVKEGIYSDLYDKVMRMAQKQ